MSAYEKAQEYWRGVFGRLNYGSCGTPRCEAARASSMRSPAEIGSYGVIERVTCEAGHDWFRAGNYWYRRETLEPAIPEGSVLP